MKLEEEEEEAVDADADGRIFRDSRWPPHYITPSERAREGGSGKFNPRGDAARCWAAVVPCSHVVIIRDFRSPPPPRSLAPAQR